MKYSINTAAEVLQDRFHLYRDFSRTITNVWPVVRESAVALHSFSLEIS